jgi:hypothetical protein
MMHPTVATAVVIAVLSGAALPTPCGNFACPCDGHNPIYCSCTAGCCNTINSAAFREVTIVPKPQNALQEEVDPMNGWIVFGLISAAIIGVVCLGMVIDWLTDHDRGK